MFTKMALTQSFLKLHYNYLWPKCRGLPGNYAKIRILTQNLGDYFFIKPFVKIDFLPVFNILLIHFSQK